MSNEKKSGFGKFLAGAAVGAGLGILFAPKKGTETRRELKVKFDELMVQIRKIDAEEVKEEFLDKVDEIRDELADLDKEKAIELAQEKAQLLKDKTQDLVELAIDKGTPVIRDVAEELRKKTIEVTKEALNKLENTEKK